ncbi:MAG: glycosyltransferase [SAR324 cluster bacterium]|nr:glycosyltransferase [SAR324 cluster bacterium]
MYIAADIACIIPTKNRPQKITNLLTTLEKQTAPCGRIIIVASGQNIENVVNDFRKRIPVEYHHSSISGQILQRNFGINLLDDRTKLVATLDDDIELEPDALERMVAFWNQVESDTAGVGFNITNEPTHKYSKLRQILGTSGPEAGKILKSGINTSITNVGQTIRSEWLNGGATMWKQEILRKYPHKEINVRWAVCEDLIYSYPIGKQYPLYVCADAHVRHEHIKDHTPNRKAMFYARNSVLWRFYFVSSNEDLSVPAFLGAIGGSIAADIFRGFHGFKKDKIEETLGETQAIFRILKALLFSGDITDLITEGNKE